MTKLSNLTSRVAGQEAITGETALRILQVSLHQDQRDQQDVAEEEEALVQANLEEDQEIMAASDLHTNDREERTTATLVTTLAGSRRLMAELGEATSQAKLVAGELILDRLLVVEAGLQLETVKVLLLKVMVAGVQQLPLARLGRRQAKEMMEVGASKAGRLHKTTAEAGENMLLLLSY